MKKRITCLCVGVGAISLVLAGCGGSSSMKTSEAYAEMPSNDGGYYEAAEEEAYYSDDIYETKLESNGTQSGATDEEIAALSSRKLIKTVNMSVETKEFDTLINNIESKIAKLGGYAENINISGNSYESYSSRYASVVARIPASHLDDFISSIEETSNITRKSENTEDVTLSYADVEAHKNSLKIEQQRLDALLEQADSLETIIALEQRMTEVRYELESYESRLRTMDNQIQYSTVYIDVNEVKEYQPEPVEELTFGQRLSYEFTSNCIQAWDAIQDFIIGFVAFLPILLVLVIILAILALVVFAIVKLVIFIVKKVAIKSNAKKQKQQANIKYAVALDSKPQLDNIPTVSDAENVEESINNELVESDNNE